MEWRDEFIWDSDVIFVAFCSELPMNDGEDSIIGEWLTRMVVCSVKFVVTLKLSSITVGAKVILSVDGNRFGNVSEGFWFSIDDFKNIFVTFVIDGWLEKKVFWELTELLFLILELKLWYISLLIKDERFVSISDCFWFFIELRELFSVEYRVDFWTPVG